MITKILGAFIIVFGCGGYGLMIAANHKKAVYSLRQLLSLLDYMQCELQYRYTPLPDLCRQAAAEANGSIREVFLILSQELEDQLSPDVSGCMNTALSKSNDLPAKTAEILSILGKSLGRFDLEGQLLSLENVRCECRTVLSDMVKHQQSRVHSYQTLGICAGAALAIILV